MFFIIIFLIFFQFIAFNFNKTLIIFFNIKKKTYHKICHISIGATDQNRTDDLLITSQLLYHLSDSGNGDPYGIRTHVSAVKGRCLNPLTNGPATPFGAGELSATRTRDTLIKSQVL